MEIATEPAAPRGEPVASGMTAEGELAELTLALVDVPSVSGDEDAISGLVVERLGRSGLTVTADADGVVALPPPTGRPLLLLAGHIDTVPAQGNLPGRLEPGRVVGLGASDMKGSIAVMLALVDRLSPGTAAGAGPRALDVALLLVRREELPVELSGTPRLLAAHPRLREAALALVMEPTSNAIELGCMGNLTVEAAWTGRAAHSARPWQGVNAAHRAVLALRRLAAAAPRHVVEAGLEYTEVASIVRVEGGIADNVIPDRLVCRVNHRYAPSTTADAALARLGALLEADELRVIGSSPSGRVVEGNALLDALVAAGGLGVHAKQAWTPVAELTGAGIDAVNFGPGDGAFAHQRDEAVGTAELARSLELLTDLVLTGAQQPGRPG